GGADEDGNFSARDVGKAVEKVVSEGVKWNWNEIVSVVVNPDDSIVMNSVDLALFKGGLTYDLKEDGGLRYRGGDGDFEVELFSGKTDEQRIRLCLPGTKYVGVAYSGEGAELSLSKGKDDYYGCGAWTKEEQKMVFASELPEKLDFDEYVSELVYRSTTERGGFGSFESGELPELTIGSSDYGDYTVIARINGNLYLRKEEENKNLIKGVVLSEEFKRPVGIMVDKNMIQIEEEESEVRISGEVGVSYLGDKKTLLVENARYSGDLEHLGKDDIGLLKALSGPILSDLLSNRKHRLNS
ncbi:MAG: hypothetical protein ABII08_01840, partial [Candidatus Beckwithbacteria bacterium]